MSTERRLAITHGEAKFHCETYRDPASDEYESRVWVTVGKMNIAEMPEDCEDQDPELIADAFNTANACDMLPSEILAKLREALDQIEGMKMELQGQREIIKHHEG